MRVPHRSRNIRDVGLNTLAFGIYVAAQQLLFFPVLSRIGDNDSFAQVILFVTVSGVIANVIGGEMANTALVRSSTYEAAGLRWDFHLLLLRLVGIACITAVVVNLFTGIPWSLFAEYALITLFTILRLYATAPYKYAERFSVVLLCYTLYALGGILGLYLTSRTDWMLAPFALAEVSALVCMVAVRILDRPGTTLMRTGPGFPRTVSTFTQLAIVALLINFVTYFDRVLIYPLLGAAAMATYYSASVFSKSMSLVINPVANAFLAKLGRIRDDRRAEVISRLVRSLPPALLLFAVANYTISYFGLRILYPIYYTDAIPLLLPVSCAGALSSCADMLQPAILRFRAPRFYLFANIAYAAVFAVSFLVMSSLWGISGFAWSTAVARACQFALYLLVAIRTPE